MAGDPIQIKRYPNRRYYARNTSQYVSLQEIEDMVLGGETVEIRDSQSGEDLTRAVLTQIIMERQPEKMSLFPSDMLHFIVRSNDAMSDFLRDYFRHSLTYLDYLQRHSAATPLTQPIHWMKAWLDGIAPKLPAEPKAQREVPASVDNTLADRIQELEERLRQLESKKE
ncbi:MAG TPA: polyhydroxyalkanoate synthesis regulator DNA-binding domain-containing protein [Pirellulaceae bacterium]|nr:polyhydroxyalkanoate synthesis regulator DNA-binding domain-containing protein [Planctomycetales bacterium]MCB9939241.1 polyhydroxyalkanoate synthesis regulator DNA-binding domain-containing protein [Planctomycetaceae bacterium]HRX81449.1 polyhydroxyalkanoate synthesis regulator DNA-binding domain-containing protein [Pirellulaceae bacterium]